MDNQEIKKLAKEIKERSMTIMTYIQYSRILSQRIEKYNYLLAPLLLSLQNTIYIELFKLFDTGKSAKYHNIYCLIDNSGEQQKFHVMIDHYNSSIKKIKEYRNKLFAHITNDISWNDYAKEENISYNLFENMIKDIVEICCTIDHSLLPNYYYGNVLDFERWVNKVSEMIQQSIKEANDKAISKRDKDQT